jgi:hypothetical protein
VQGTLETEDIVLAVVGSGNRADRSIVVIKERIKTCSIDENIL